MQRNWKTRLTILSIGILGVILASAGCGKSTANQPPKRGIPEVAVVAMKEEQVAISTELPGRTSAYLVAEVRPQVSGIIQKRLFTEGDDVKAGDVLYQINPAPYQASYNNAMAALARAEANLPPIQLKAERYKELIVIKAVSQQDYDDVSAAVKQAEAEVAVNKAAVETARINLTYTRITAPISGRTGKSHVTVGALATAHQTAPLTTIQQLDPIYVDAMQSSANLLALKRNMEAGRINGASSRQARAKLLLEDGTPYPSEGNMKFSDVTVDPSTGSFSLRTVFPNPKHTLLPGMYVRPVILEGVVNRAILAPQQGVSRDSKGNPMALIVDSEGKVQVRMLTLDRAIDDKWLVTSGLSTGDRVIVEGIQKVSPGAPAKAIPFDAGRNEDPKASKVNGPPSKAN
ncbi:MAG: efflux RND transporter periplasmic adaptor subunit [Syntrophobacterales bacterium]|jgi:membrane fusion protein (multidrug efflux system)|nr:efflux RND transporter periplasmic adaptor subunit [Syntrophobacterales bacterium]